MNVAFIVRWDGGASFAILWATHEGMRRFKGRDLVDFERTRLLGGLVNGLIGPRGRIGPMFEADVAE